MVRPACRQSEHAITDLRSGPGELSFEARIGDLSKRIWIRADSDFLPSADAALAAGLMPAMRPAAASVEG